MRVVCSPIWAWAAILLLTGCSSSKPATNDRAFESVALILTERLVDVDVRTQQLPALIERYRSRARDARSGEEEYVVIDTMLSHIPLSHLALLSNHAYIAAMAQIMNEPIASIGFDLLETADGYFVTAFLNASPAAQAGIVPGDRIVSIDDVATHASPRLDRPNSDAHVTSMRTRSILTQEGDVLRLRIERTPGEMFDVDVAVHAFEALDAAKRVVIHEVGDIRAGSMHLPFVFHFGADRIIRENLNGPLRACDALILDLRGRGGSTRLVPHITRTLDHVKNRRNLPIIVLIDRHTRSAKEAIAWELKDRGIALLVGETTAGASLQAHFVRITDDVVLMYPRRRGAYSDRIEGRGVDPHIHVAPKHQFTNNADPIMTAALREAGRLVADRKKSHIELLGDPNESELENWTGN